MKNFRPAAVLVLSALAMSACDDDDSTGVTIADLEGQWEASSFAYTDAANPNFSIDAVQTVGGTVTLDVEENGAFEGTLYVPGLTQNPANPNQTITVPIGGTLRILDQRTLEVDFDGQTESLGLFDDFEADFALNGDVLTWENDDTSFDFPDSLEESAGLDARGDVDATLTATFTR